MSIFLVVVTLITMHVWVEAKPQIGNTLFRCPQDPILKDMETHFSDLSYIKQQVSCLTNPTLPRCEVGQRCENCCCDDVGLKLRELAPVVLRDPDESTCADQACVCIKREGRRVLQRLKNGQSSTGVKYLQFYNQLVHFYS